MSVEIFNCPYCGKETFNRKFCVFCGENIQKIENQKNNKTSESEKMRNNQSNLETFDKRLEELVEIKKSYDKKVEGFNADCSKYEIEEEGRLSFLEKEKNDISKKTEELKVLHNLEELSEKDYEEKAAVLTQKLLQNEKNIKKAQLQLRELKKIRKKLVHLTSKYIEVESFNSRKRMKEKLSELLSAYKDKKIGDELYAKLKAKYEKELKKTTC